MEQIFNLAFLAGLLGAMMRMATPIIFGTLGEIIVERSGVLNLGIEGTMLMGAMIGFLTTLHTGSLWLGVLAAAGIGILLSLLMAFLSVNLGLSQHVSGLGITLLSTGLAMFIYRLAVGSPVSPPTIKPFVPVAIPFLSSLPVIGRALFQQYSLVYIAFLLIPIIWVLLYKTSWGLVIRTVGENPLAADTVGINVNLVRTLCLAAGGALMGIGGAFLTLAHQDMFLLEVVGGRGWVCIAMVIFGNWDPVKGAGGALLFGFLDGLQLRLQSIWYKIPFHLFLLVPYLITIIALVIVSRKASAPNSLLKPYRREEKG
ncbi:MAG: Putative ABC transporter permease protein [Synergistales bacterium 53_16]|nr:MAG: Putative ABC transporter permease protein [Synergistales bacterium 53_16]KUL04763.1 MAG: Putative ABC transporter permease protein [Synergistales bacterium 54_9]HAG22244.1 ABC transporter permease [Synergistaceae bacterium]